MDVRLTCIAAEKLGRKWVGVDVSPKAIGLVKSRMAKQLGSIFPFIERFDIPPMYSGGKKLPSYTTHKHALYGKQEGKSNGCKVLFPISNLQLLCGACNSMKGNKSQQQLIVQLQKLGII